jgi:DNA-binding transcriptional LysR family regulator
MPCGTMREGVIERAFNWNDLRFFLEVARSGSLSAAARAMRTDHATVGRRVMALEQAIAQTLFHRSPLGYMLTPDGEALVPLAEQIEARATEAAARAGRPQAGLAGSIRLTTPDGFGNHFLASHLPTFAGRYPRLSLELVTIQQILSHSLREGDLAVTLSPPKRGQFAVARLANYQLRIYGAASYLDRAPEIRNRADLMAHEFVGYVDDLIFAKELDYLDEVISGLKARLQSTSLYAQVTATRLGQGLCVLPTYIAAPHRDLVEVLPDEVTLQRSYWVSCHVDLVQLPRVKALRDFLVEACEAEPHFSKP